jgi:polyvinyl alcohol dehydrogenase (cytochrome)
VCFLCCSLLFVSAPQRGSNREQTHNRRSKSHRKRPVRSSQERNRKALLSVPWRIVGQSLFNKDCASCHHHAMSSANENQTGRAAPSTETLAQMSPEAIYATLTTGDMVQQAKALSESDKRAIAEFFGGRPLGAAYAGDAKNMTNHCASNPPITDASAGSSSWNGWSADLANTRFQSASAAGISVDEVPHLKVKWAFRLPSGGETSGEPSLFGGHIFFGDYNSFAYSLDAASGCVYWSFRTDAQVRTAALIARVKHSRRATYAVFFGDKKANLYALDAHTGAFCGDAT